MSRFLNKYRNFRNAQEGNATIEFVFLFPCFIFLFLTGFEAGYYMVRNVMLERAVDVAVRDVRLGNGRVPTFAALKTRICSETAVIPDCLNSLQVELQPVDIAPGGIAAIAGPVRCIDTASDADPLTGTVYNVGDANNLMVVRVCALAQPLFPSTGIGVGMRVDAEGNYALVATTAFINEPGNRGFADATGSSGPGLLASFDAGNDNGSDGYDPGASEPVNSGGDETSTNPGLGGNP